MAYNPINYGYITHKIHKPSGDIGLINAQSERDSDAMGCHGMPTDWGWGAQPWDANIEENRRKGSPGKEHDLHL